MDRDGATGEEMLDGTVSSDVAESSPNHSESATESSTGGGGNRSPIGGGSGSIEAGNVVDDGSGGAAADIDSGDANFDGATDASNDGNVGDANESGAGSSSGSSSNGSSGGSSSSSSSSGSSSSGGSSSSSSSGGNPPPQCPGGDGLFCGGDTVSGDPNTLFCCYLGSKTVVQACQGGCQVMQNRVNDRCAVQSCPNGPGYYCGGDGVPGCSHTLYYCSGGTLTSPQVCPNGCQVVPGQNDHCI